MTQQKEEKELLVGFLRETYPMLDELEETILSLEVNPNNAQGFTTCLRALHTIKGTSACLGLTDISDFSHQYESFINKIKSKILDQEDIDILLKATDFLRKLYAHAKYRQSFSPEIARFGNLFDRHLNNRKQHEEKEDHNLESSQNKESTQTAREGTKWDTLVPFPVLKHFIELGEESIVSRNTIVKMMGLLQKRFPKDKMVESIQENINGLSDIISTQQVEINKMKQASMEKVFRILRRFVRDLSKKCNKKINFMILGEQLMVDTQIRGLLGKTLVHIVNNSIYHGIEKKEERTESGKNEKGNICIRYYEENDKIVVNVEDDGRGVDSDKIVNTALKLKIHTKEELDQMNEKQRIDLIFKPGLSTADEVTTLSGRGVGMDMVKSSVEEMGGKVLFKSTLGKGSSLKMIIPTPHLNNVIKALTVEAEKEVFNIPIDVISEIVSYHTQMDNKNTSYEIEKTMLLKHSDKVIPLIHLGEYLKLDQNNIGKNKKMDIVIVRNDRCYFGLIVDKARDIDEIVVKRMVHLGTQNNPSCFQGISLTEHGKVGLILDIDGFRKEQCTLSERHTL